MLNDIIKKNILLNKKFLTAFLLSVPVFLILSLIMYFISTNRNNILQIISSLISVILYTSIFFLMIFTQKTDKYRAIIFILATLTFFLSIIYSFMQNRGFRFITEEMFISLKVGFCPLASPMLILPMIFNRIIIFPGSILGKPVPILMMFCFWIIINIIFGRSACSWICPFGGYEDGFSRILKKPLIKNIKRKWAYIPYAFLIFIIITSAITLEPIYCIWICPFKTVSEAAKITSPIILIQTIIFVSLFINLVIIHPILSKKRTQCSFLCPAGAISSIANKINIFEITINKDLCIKCSKCIKECPTFSIDEKSLDSGKPYLNCTRCGRCIDNCPEKAINYHIKGTGNKPYIARNIFVFIYFIFGSFLGLLGTKSTILYIMNFISTGNIFIK